MPLDVIEEGREYCFGGSFEDDLVTDVHGLIAQFVGDPSMETWLEVCQTGTDYMLDETVSELAP
ncbi:hypothetical protein [Neisseria iguanae]|uniref:Uncharacterized protein n=1 Tax=Neisseria iguanae TaxID=90242 RepID=A0A2P7TY54_9NEIS|nr:hypothetical protein [Neisseria iguanae]PSJ79621.1 hypothetical protein C7N83_11090 [Neisseria iguanae]